MNSNTKSNGKGKKLIMALVGIAVIAGGYFYYTGSTEDVAAGVTYSEARVQSGDLVSSISSSGTVEPIEQYDVASLVSGDILSDTFDEGDMVEEGTLLYSIDDTEALNSIRQTEISLEKQVISDSQTQDVLVDRYIRSDISGVITELYVEDGDEVSKGTKIADVVNYNDVTVTLPFNAADAATLSVGDYAEVYVESTGEVINGVIDQVSTGSYTSALGVPVSDVIVTFANPGALQEGAEVSVISGSVACNETGLIEMAEIESITANTSGEVTGLNYNKGDEVSAGALILTLYSEDAEINATSSTLNLESAQLDLEERIEQLEDYTIEAPISGTVIQKSYKGGDTLDGNKSTLCVIADMSALTFEMAIDELDIKKVYEGQPVVVTADAAEGMSFEGYIDSISILGTTSSSVTTYPVTVVIENYEGLLPGMNVTAEIIVEQVEDALMLPISAIGRNSTVQVLAADAGADATLSADGMYATIPVETGVTTDDYVEIVSGLSEGDTVYIATIMDVGTDSDIGISMGMGMGGAPTSGGTPPTGGGGGTRPGA